MALAFSKDFLWGAACSAYQIEGAWDQDGKGLSCHDHYARLPKYAHYYEKGRPDTCGDFYHHYREDIDIMADNNLKSFRYSIAWARLFPNDPDNICQEGIDYYNNVFSYLNEKGIKPFVDLFHWDLPQWVIERGGALNREFITWFEKYAKACYSCFGDKVQYWSTMNEPNNSIFAGYHSAIDDGPGVFPPFENDLTKAFHAYQTMLLAHMRAVKLFREMGCEGKIGAVIDSFPFYPYDITDERDFYAADRRFEIYDGKWFGPLLTGKYPEILSDTYLEHMPENFEQELAAEYQEIDFIGLNYYCPYYARYKAESPYFEDCPDPEEGLHADWQQFADANVTMKVFPEGLYDLLHIVNNKYHPKEIMITENGLAFARDPKKFAEPPAIHDPERIKYIRAHIMMLNRAIESGINVTGYFYWAIESTYEQGLGFDLDFGLIGINYDTFERIPRDSFKWYGKFIKANTCPDKPAMG